MQYRNVYFIECIDSPSFRTVTSPPIALASNLSIYDHLKGLNFQ